MLSLTFQSVIQVDYKITIVPGHHLFNPGGCILQLYSAHWGKWGRQVSVSASIWFPSSKVHSESLQSMVLCQVLICHCVPLWKMVSCLHVSVQETNTAFSTEICNLVQLSPKQGLHLLLVKIHLCQRGQRLIQRNPFLRFWHSSRRAPH